MSIYLNNLNPNITTVIKKHGITFKKGSRVIDMTCKKVGVGYEMKFTFSENGSYTKIKARDAKELSLKLVNVIHDMFRCYTLKGMI